MVSAKQLINITSIATQQGSGASGAKKLQFKNIDILFATIAVKSPSEIQMDNQGFEQYVSVGQQLNKVVIFGPLSVINEYLMQAKYSNLGEEDVREELTFLEVCVNYKGILKCFNSQVDQE